MSLSSPMSLSECSELRCHGGAIYPSRYRRETNIVTKLFGTHIQFLIYTGGTTHQSIIGYYFHGIDPNTVFSKNVTRYSRLPHPAQLIYLLTMRPTLILTTVPLLTTATLLQDVSKSDFGSLIKEHELLLTLFSSRNYEPVHHFFKVFEHAADSVQTPSIIVNCDEEKELCKEYDINAYPAVRLFKRRSEDNADVEITRYRGKRTKEAIQSFVTKHEMPTVTHISPENLPSFKKIDDIVVIAYLRPDQEALLGIFQDVAARHRHEFVFGHVDDVTAADAEGLAMPSIVCYKNTDGDNKVLSGHFADANLEILLESAKIDIIGDFTERNMDAYMVVSSSNLFLVLILAL
jgi:hypothetical protein